jgi:hypothetical protein
MKLKLQMKCLFKTALTISCSSIILISLSSYKENQLKAGTIYKEPVNKYTQVYSPAESEILALNASNFEKFGDDFLMAWKAGKSSQFIPDQVDLDEFLYSAFESRYTNLSVREKNSIKFNLFDSFKALHTNPSLISGYKKMIFKKGGLSKEGNSYVYNFTSQIVGYPIRNGAIRIKQINGQFQIVDIKSNYWIANFLKEKYSQVKDKISVVDFMKSFEMSIKKQWGT